jgi:hypothetical protein
MTNRRTCQSKSITHTHKRKKQKQWQQGDAQQGTLSSTKWHQNLASTRPKDLAGRSEERACLRPGVIDVLLGDDRLRQHTAAMDKHLYLLIHGVQVQEVLALAAKVLLPYSDSKPLSRRASCTRCMYELAHNPNSFSVAAFTFSAVFSMVEQSEHSKLDWRIVVCLDRMFSLYLEYQLMVVWSTLLCGLKH